MTDIIDDGVCPMDVDSDYEEDPSTKPEVVIKANVQDISSDEEDDHNTIIFKNHECEYNRLGIKYLRGLGMDDLDDIYSYMYGDEPFCNMTKVDVISCIAEYYQ